MCLGSRKDEEATTISHRQGERRRISLSRARCLASIEDTERYVSRTLRSQYIEREGVRLVDVFILAKAFQCSGTPAFSVLSREQGFCQGRTALGILKRITKDMLNEHLQSDDGVFSRLC